MNYEKLAQKIVSRAKKQGAQQAEAYIEVGRQSSCRVRDGEIEHLSEAASKGVGVRVIKNGKLGFAYTSDFEEGSLNGFVDRAIALSNAAAPNKHNGLPTRADLGKAPQLSELFDPAVAALPTDWKVKTALETERAGKALDPRISTFASVGAGESVGETYIASSEGAKAGFSTTFVFLYASPVASENGQLQTSYWYDYKRFISALDSPEQIGKEAARRALRMLGARKVKTQQVPVIFDPSMAASFVANVAHAANGDLVHKKSSIFVDRMDQKIAPEGVTIVDDGLLPRGLGTSPVDGEGVPARRTSIVERGMLRSFLYDAFTARKAKAKTTGNASRGYRSLPGISPNNLYLEKGTLSKEEIVRGVKSGFFVTSMLGSGADVITGDYSRGANGLWIENGELGHPVQEVTVAGNLMEMLGRIDAIGSDLEFRGGVNAPTLRFSELTVSGE